MESTTLMRFPAHPTWLEWEMTFDSQVQDSFYYFISINENTLPGGSVEGIIGHYFFCAVLDTAGVTVESDPPRSFVF